MTSVPAAPLIVHVFLGLGRVVVQQVGLRGQLKIYFKDLYPTYAHIELHYIVDFAAREER